MTIDERHREIVLRLATTARNEAIRTGSTLDTLAALEAEKELALADAAVYAAWKYRIDHNLN